MGLDFPLKYPGEDKRLKRIFKRNWLGLVTEIPSRGKKSEKNSEKKLA